MAGWLYDPTKADGKFDYHLPIHSSESIMPFISWQNIIDTYVANYGHDVNMVKLLYHVKETMNMLENEMLDTLLLCRDRIMEEIRDV